MSKSETKSTELVIPAIGAVVNLEDAAQVALTLDDIRDLESQFRYIKEELTRALVHASETEGSKTLHLAGVTVTIKSGPAKRYDAEEIETGLRAAGMSEERLREVVKLEVSYKVDGNEAKRVSGANPAYAAVIEAHTRVEETRPSATVTRAKK